MIVYANISTGNKNIKLSREQDVKLRKSFQKVLWLQSSVLIRPKTCPPMPGLPTPQPHPRPINGNGDGRVSEDQTPHCRGSGEYDVVEP